MERPYPLCTTQAIARNLPERAQLFASFHVAVRAYHKDVWPDAGAQAIANRALGIFDDWRKGFCSDGDRRIWRSLTFIGASAPSPRERAQQQALLCITSAMAPFTEMECLEHAAAIPKWETRPTLAWDDSLWPAILAEEKWLFEYFVNVSAFCKTHPMPDYPLGSGGFDEWLRKFPSLA